MSVMIYIQIILAHFICFIVFQGLVIWGKDMRDFQEPLHAETIPVPLWKGLSCVILIFCHWFIILRSGHLSHKHLLQLVKWIVLLQDKEAYCEPIRESLKTILSWGWIVERIGENDFASLYNKSRMASQASQVRAPADIHRYNIIFI